jgi:hypothetical protein
MGDESMAKKPVSKKKSTARTRAGVKRTATSKGGIAVAGDIHAKRDVIIGKQQNIKASRDVVLGDQYHYLSEQVANITKPEEFIASAQEVQAQLAEIKKQPDLLPAQARRIEAVEGDVQEAVEEAKKDQPAGERIRSTLDSAKETMDKLAEGVKSAVGLGSVLGGLAQIAIRLFGG